MAQHALYFNGLGSGHTRRRERFAINYLAKHGLIVEHVPINWYSDEPFEDLLARLVEVTKRKLAEHGTLTLIGSSAGGSLTLNVFKIVNDTGLTAVTLCSRLHETKLAAWDPRTLARMAHLGTPRSSQLFYDSVIYCTDQTIPSLDASDRTRITIIQQITDDVVPRRTMGIDGVAAKTVWAIGHGWGIAEGVRQLPYL